MNHTVSSGDIFFLLFGVLQNVCDFGTVDPNKMNSKKQTVKVVQNKALFETPLVSETIGL